MGTVLERFAGIPYIWGVLLLLVIGVGYTIYGGMRGVIYTDVLQGVISLAFGVVALSYLFYAVGGYTKLIDALPESHTLFTSDAITFGAFPRLVRVYGLPSPHDGRPHDAHVHHPQPGRVSPKRDSDGGDAARDGRDFPLPGTDQPRLRRPWVEHGPSHPRDHPEAGPLAYGLAGGGRLGVRHVHLGLRPCGRERHHIEGHRPGLHQEGRLPGAIRPDREVVHVGLRVSGRVDRLARPPYIWPWSSWW